MAKALSHPVKLKGAFEVLSGDEDPWVEGGGVKLTHVTGVQRFQGDIDGDGSVAWLMCYVPVGGARFVGMQRIEGSIAGRSGSIVMESVGDHDGKASKGTWRVIPGAGTGELAGIEGRGSFDAPGGKQVDYELELEFD
jgi:Protein of unknown function (DUF3224)